MKPIVVFTCNKWKKKPNFRLVGVYTSRIKFQTILNTMLTHNIIRWTEKQYKGSLVTSDDSIDFLQRHLDYIHLQEIEFNERQ